MAAVKIHYKLTVWQNSCINYYIYPVFKAFPLNLRSIQKSSWNTYEHVGIGYIPHAHPYPYQWQSLHPRQTSKTHQNRRF